MSNEEAKIQQTLIQQMMSLGYPPKVILLVLEIYRPKEPEQETKIA